MLFIRPAESVADLGPATATSGPRSGGTRGHGLGDPEAGAADEPGGGAIGRGSCLEAGMSSERMQQRPRLESQQRVESR
jgi:hypothetical protein